jgi:hypothetical protein
MLGNSLTISILGHNRSIIRDAILKQSLAARPSRYAAASRPASRGTWWSATRHQELVLSGSARPPGGLAAARAGQRLASRPGAAGEGSPRWRRDTGTPWASAPAGGRQWKRRLNFLYAYVAHEMAFARVLIQSVDRLNMKAGYGTIEPTLSIFVLFKSG